MSTSSNEPNSPQDAHDATDPLDSEVKFSEASIQKRVLLALGSLPDVRLWRQNAGRVRVCKTHRACPHCYWLQLAPDGAADLSGVVAGGRRLEVEVKSLVGTQRKSQENFEAMMRRFGAHYLLVRSEEDALEQLKRIL